MKLYKFYWDCKYGELAGLFVSTSDLVEVTDDEHTINELVEKTQSLTICGYNPFDYCEDEEIESEYNSLKEGLV